jgi:uncharacterized Zn finger protein (UPF0148 family)
MKCRYCDTELKDGAKFCPNCGREVIESNVCISCGEQIKPGASFCPHCGANQHEEAKSEPISEVEEIVEQPNETFDNCINCGEQIKLGTLFCPHCGANQHEEAKPEPIPEVEEIVEQPKEEIPIEQQPETQQEIQQDNFQPYEETKSKKGIWIIFAILLLCVIAGAGYYFFNNSNGNDSYVAASDTIETDADSIEKELDIHSVDGIKARMDEILSKGMGMPDGVAVEKYFSKDYNESFFKVEEYDKNNVPEGEIGFWDESIWADGQGGLGSFHHEIRTVSKASEEKASTIVDYISDEVKGEKLTVKFDLCFENGNWFIDEITSDNGYVYKEAMKKYIKESAQGNYSSSSFENKIYKGNGKGGGLYTEMTISFLANNLCLCESDWYQTFSSPKVFQGTYSVNDNKVVVRCKVDDTDYDFNFDISSDGRILEFDNSDPEMEGSMAINVMSLEMQKR